MILKFIDARGHTHFRECSQVTYVGHGEDGRGEALRYDGEPGEILNYDSPIDVDEAAGVVTELLPRRYFIVYPLEGAGRRQVIASACRGAWLMSDKGRTIENLLACYEPGPLDGYEVNEALAHR